MLAHAFPHVVKGPYGKKIRIINLVVCVSIMYVQYYSKNMALLFGNTSTLLSVERDVMLANTHSIIAIAFKKYIKGHQTRLNNIPNNF